MPTLIGRVQAEARCSLGMMRYALMIVEARCSQGVVPIDQSSGISETSERQPVPQQQEVAYSSASWRLNVHHTSFHANTARSVPQPPQHRPSGPGGPFSQASITMSVTADPGFLLHQYRPFFPIHRKLFTDLRPPASLTGEMPSRTSDFHR